jgi:hypothetical protein
MLDVEAARTLDLPAPIIFRLLWRPLPLQARSPLSVPGQSTSTMVTTRAPAGVQT